MKKRMTYLEREEITQWLFISCLALVMLGLVFIGWGVGAVEGAGGPVQIALGFLCLVLAAICFVIWLWIESPKRRSRPPVGGPHEKVQK